MGAGHHLSELDIWFDPDVLEDLSWVAFQEGVDWSNGLPDEDVDGTPITLQLPLVAKEDKEAVLSETQRAIQRWHSRVKEMREEEVREEGGEQSSPSAAPAGKAARVVRFFDMFTKRASVASVGSDHRGSGARGSLRLSRTSTSSKRSSVGARKNHSGT